MQILRDFLCTKCDFAILSGWVEDAVKDVLCVAERTVISRDGARSYFYRVKGKVVCAEFGFFGFLGRGFEFAVDGDVGILVEARIRFHAQFGFLAASTDTEIVLEEADVPFDGREGMVAFEGVCTALRLFDEFAVCYASGRPCFRKMVGVELEDCGARNTADDDVFFVSAAIFDGVHRTPESVITLYRLKIAHSASVGSGNLRRRDKAADIAF